MTTPQKREQAQQVRQALLLAMQDTGNTTDIIKCEFFSSDVWPGGETIDITEAMGGSGWYDRPTKKVDPYLQMRKAR